VFKSVKEPVKTSNNLNIREEDLIDLIKQGKDNEVIQIFYKKVLPPVTQYVKRRSGSKDDAWDIFHDAILLLYRQIFNGQYRQDKYKVYGYLYRLSCNLWINKVKRENRLVTLEPEDHEILGSDPGEYTVTDLPVKENRNLLQTFFADIGDKCIELLTYTIYYNLMIEDIQIRMDFNSEGAVKMQLKRCREKLLQKVKDNPALAEKIRS
jgi:RNA polymerase sigma factor (sigma-70 family)